MISVITSIMFIYLTYFDISMQDPCCKLKKMNGGLNHEYVNFTFHEKNNVTLTLYEPPSNMIANITSNKTLNVDAMSLMGLNLTC